jgi:exosortase/archaeosortase family protein
MSKEKLSLLIKKYNITPWKVIVAVLILLLIVIRFLVQNKATLEPVEYIFGLYADFLMVNVKALLSMFNHKVTFNFPTHEIIGAVETLKIDRFFFSINQIAIFFLICLITKSPVKDKLIYFLIGFLIFTFYNSLRILVHVLVPETATVHHWLFNTVLIFRWLIVLIFAWVFWKKYTSVLDYLKTKLKLSDSFIKSAFIKLAVIIIVYHFVVIIAFNDYFFISGQHLIDLVLGTSKFVLDLMGYESWINHRLIYGYTASLYMDDACLGIGLMFFFAAFIYVLPGAAKNKWWFIPLGLAIIIALNCVRVILIFVNLTNNASYTIPLEIHDLFTYPVLVVTFFMWMIWINKFSIVKKNGHEIKPTS